MRGSTDFEVDSGATNVLLLNFELGAWFKDVAIAQATPTNRGEIHINTTSNKPLYDQILKNIRRSTRFGEDLDGDSILDDDEAVGDGTDFVED